MYLKYNYKDSEVYEHELHELKKQFSDLKKEELLNLCASLKKYVDLLEEQNSLLRSLTENKLCKRPGLFPLVKITSKKPLKKPSIIIEMPMAK